MITADLRQAICRAAGFRLDPGLRPGPEPGTYSSTAPFDVPGTDSLSAAREMARRLADEPWVESAEATGTGYLTIVVTRAALAAVSARTVTVGPDCVRNNALAGTTASAPPPADISAAETWPRAHAAVVAEVTARLRHASGATPAPRGPASERGPARERASVSHRRPSMGVGDSPMPFVPATDEARVGDEARVKGEARGAGPGSASGEMSADTPVDTSAGTPADTPAAAVAWAGEDAVRFALASISPGHPVQISAKELARQVLTNPAFAVRYAHARAASVPRWAGVAEAARVPRWAEAASVPRWAGGAAAPGHLPAAWAGESELLGLLSWLPERVAIAARRGRPDEFARYLAELAAGSIVATGAASNLELAAAARVGLAAGLELLGIAAPDRL